MRHYLVSLPLTFTILLSCATSALASVRTVFSAQAEGVEGKIIELKVGPGAGINIILPEGETVKKAWLDDKSRIGLSSDGDLCQRSEQQQSQNCKDEEAGMLHLLQIEKIHFPNLLHSPDGKTLLTVRVEGRTGRKVYLFKVTPVPGTTEIVSLVIRPDSERPAPLLLSTPIRGTSSIPSTNSISTSHLVRSSQPRTHAPQLSSSNSSTFSSSTPAQPTTFSTTVRPQTKQPRTSIAANSHPLQATKYIQQAIVDANAVRSGLIVARDKNQINYGTTRWKQAQSAIRYLLRGSSRQEAAAKAGLPLEVLAQLIKWGQHNPRLIPRIVND